MILKEYRPAFFDGYENQSHEFLTLDELYRLNWVKSWIELPGFKKFFICHPWDISEDKSMMFAKFENGEQWGVGSIYPKSEAIKLGIEIID